MPWFKVDDGFWSHPKTLQLSDGAQALWLRAGSWSMHHLTDGVIPAYALPLLRAKQRFVNELVGVSLWFSDEGAYRFHDWDRYQPTREQVEADRDAAAERKRRSRATSRRDSQGEDGGSPDGRPPSPSHPIPSQPDQTLRLDQSSSVSRRGPDVDLMKIKSAVMANCGRDCSDVAAWLVIGTVLERTKTRPKNPTAYITRAIAADPFTFQQMIDELPA